MHSFILRGSGGSGDTNIHLNGTEKRTKYLKNKKESNHST